MAVVVLYEEAVSAWNESRSFPGANFGGPPSTGTRVGAREREMGDETASRQACSRRGGRVGGGTTDETRALLLP